MKLKKPLDEGLFAEKEGFEPPDLLQSTVFKTAAFDRSAISPVCRYHFVIASANIRTFFGYASVLLEKMQLFFKDPFNCFICFALQKFFFEKSLVLNILCNFQPIPYHSHSFALLGIGYQTDFRNINIM